MAKIDHSYKELLEKILSTGFRYEDPNRKGTYRIQIPSYTFKHKFINGFPAITTKELYWKGVVTELLWFLRGDTDIKYLLDNNINIWNKDAYNFLEKHYTFKEGTKPTLKQYIKNYKHWCTDLGRIYGAQWREFMYNGYTKQKVDQISNLINGLIKTPMGTRHIVTSWNPAELEEMALPPCHWSFEILTEPLVEKYECCGVLDKKGVCECNKTPKYGFTLKWHQRSVDTFLGLPFNIASYALLAQIIAKLTGIHALGIEGDLSNVHIYEPHIDAVKEQLKRQPDKYWKPLQLESFGGFKMDMRGDIDQWLDSKEISDFKIKNYQSYSAIKAEMLAYDN